MERISFDPVLNPCHIFVHVQAMARGDCVSEGGQLDVWGASCDPDQTKVPLLVEAVHKHEECQGEREWDRGP